MEEDIKELEELLNYEFNQLSKKEYQAIEHLIDMFEKQQKEIEELKANKGYHLGFIDGGIAKRYEYEDKIKAKIEELQDDIKYSANPLSIDNSKFGIKVLQSLLQEGDK